mmetsp:Transcript_25823/g.59441  ORF Transcript_25823/g.59441 Transcript_25823/m.59441 type:complete len:129 (-) Transcript_25823:205-591(-)
MKHKENVSQKEVTYYASPIKPSTIMNTPVQWSPRLRARRDDLEPFLEHAYLKSVENRDGTDYFVSPPTKRLRVDFDSDGIIIFDNIVPETQEDGNYYSITQDSRLEEVPGTEDQGNGLNFLLDAGNMN